MLDAIKWPILSITDEDCQKLYVQSTDQIQPVALCRF